MLGERIYDRELHLLDRALFLGHEPAVVLHAMLGTTFSAHLLSTIYLWFLPLVPLALTAWVVWSRNISYGYWFVTSQCIAWTLGTASYYALPTLGPGFEYAWLYEDLDTTASSRLMEALQYGRQDVNHSVLEGAVQSVAGFASLHCAITLLVAMMAQATFELADRALAAVGQLRGHDRGHALLRLALRRRRRRRDRDRAGGLLRRWGDERSALRPTSGGNDNRVVRQGDTPVTGEHFWEKCSFCDS